ncbi:MAG TPA: hypothetical protein EYG86_07850 [Crocinitomicaceae bacterium]|nr:hypothetical protein [Crocinitomicaceae bacterium]
MRILLIILSLSLVFASCKKKGKADFILRGAVTNTSFSIGLSGATVRLYSLQAGTTQEQLIGTTSTSSDGTYSFVFPRDNVLSYRLLIEKQNYFSVNSSINFSDMTIENDNVRDFATTAKAWAKLHFIKQSGVGSVNYTIIVGKKNCDECCSSNQQVLTSISDTSVYCINDGNSVFTYSYFIPGTTIVGEKTGVTIPFDTTEILLTF